MSCNDTYDVRKGGHIPFSTALFFQIQQNISSYCPTDPRLTELQPNTLVLTATAAMALTGASNNSFLSTWQFTPYPSDLILTRFQVWKVPLIQLITLNPQPPQSRSIGLFSLFHLRGDTIDTISSLIFTLQATQNRLRRFKQNGMGTKRLQGLTLLVCTLEQMGDEIDAIALENR